VIAGRRIGVVFIEDAHRYLVVTVEWIGERDST
jgi:hypothetical protein